MTATFYWTINAVEKRKGGFNPPMSTVIEATDETSARAEFEARHPAYRITKVKKGRKRIDTYDELAEWLRQNKVGPEEARGAVQVMVINSRAENIRPWPCPFCKADLNRVGTDNIDNAYYCKACKGLLQVG